MRLLHEIAIFQTVKSKMIISLFETVRLLVSISLRNLYNSLNSKKEISAFFQFSGHLLHYQRVKNKNITAHAELIFRTTK